MANAAFNQPRSLPTKKHLFSTKCLCGSFLYRLVVLLNMQKKAQQLDLFGFPMEDPAPPAKKSRPAPVKQPAPAATPAMPLTIAQPPAVPVLEEPVTTIKKVRVARSESGQKRGRKSFREMDSEVDLIEVPSEEKLKEKLYYSISEVAGWFKVNTSLLRFWENEFDILQPRKTRKGDRLFRVEDIKNLQLIYFLLRQRKFSIEGAKSYLLSNKKEIDKQHQLVQSLNRLKGFLLEIQQQL